jgi:hypothetical protein
MVEADRQQPLSGHVLDTAMAAPGPELGVQVGDRLGDAGVVGGQHRPARRWVTQAVQDRDALGRPQDHVERGHGALAVGAAEQLASAGVAALEHGLEPGHGCFALQAEAGGAGAIPPPWGLPVARQVLLVVGGQLAGVVLLPPHRQLGHIRHHPPLPPRRRWHQQRTRGALLSSENGFGVRVGRKLACERRLRGVRGCGYFLVRSDRQLWKQGMAGAVDG